jgi:hypothetical protein
VRTEWCLETPLHGLPLKLRYDAKLERKSAASHRSVRFRTLQLNERLWAAAIALWIR